MLMSISCSLVIGENFTGPFILNGVQNITGYLMTTPTDPEGPEVTSLTSVEAPDLLSLDTFLIARAPAVTSVSLPKLTSISNVIVEGGKWC